MPNGKKKYAYISQKDLDERYAFNEEDNLYYYYGSNIVAYNPEPNANWAFDDKTRTLSMFTDDGYYAYTFTITMSEDRNSFTGIDTKGQTYTFVRAE